MVLPRVPVRVLIVFLPSHKPNNPSYLQLQHPRTVMRCVCAGVEDLVPKGGGCRAGAGGVGRTARESCHYHHPTTWSSSVPSPPIFVSCCVSSSLHLSLCLLPTWTTSQSGTHMDPLLSITSNPEASDGRSSCCAEKIVTSNKRMMRSFSLYILSSVSRTAGGLGTFIIDWVI